MKFKLSAKLMTMNGDSMKNNYVIWATKNEEGGCVLDDLQGIDKVIKLN